MALCRARLAFAAFGHGVVPAGALVDSSDPLVVRFPQFFDELASSAPSVVEQATAAPGEKRATRARKATA